MGSPAPRDDRCSVPETPPGTSWSVSGPPGHEHEAGGVTREQGPRHTPWRSSETPVLYHPRFRTSGHGFSLGRHLVLCYRTARGALRSTGSVGAHGVGVAPCRSAWTSAAAPSPPSGPPRPAPPPLPPHLLRRLEAGCPAQGLRHHLNSERKTFARRLQA